MKDIYKLHEKAFSNVSAYVILKNGERVATIAFKFPKDGAGRLYAYVHYFGSEMVRGYAGGYGYDKRSAAVEDAIDNVNHAQLEPGFDLTFIRALTNIGGDSWDNALRDAGFTVLQAV